MRYTHIPVVMLASFSLLCGQNASAQNNQSAGCAQYGAQDFEIGVRIDGSFYGGRYGVRVVDVATGAQVDDRAVVGLGSQPYITTGCGWVAHVAEPTSGANRVGLLGNTLYRIEIYDEWYLGPDEGRIRIAAYDYFFDTDLTPTSTSFFAPNATSAGYPDLLFLVDEQTVRAYPTRLGNGSLGRDVDDFFSDSNWILPYDLRKICAVAGCDPEDDADYVFLTPSRSDAPGFPRTYDTTAGAIWLVPAGRSYSWSGTEISSLRFGAGGQLWVDGSFTSSGMLFTASNPSLGWEGLTYWPGSKGALTDTIFSWVGSTATSWYGSAVSIYGSSPALTDVRIQNAASGATAGVTVGQNALGPPAAPVIIRLTASNLTDTGIYVGGGARADVVRGTISSNFTGLSSSGSGSIVYLAPGTQFGNFRGPSITNNTGLGVLATSSADVRFGAPSPQYGLATVADNGGRGLTATSGAALYAGTATVYQRNRIFRNFTSNSTGNVLASGSGSRAYVQCAWWNTPTPTSSDFRAGQLAGGTLVLTNYLTADPYLAANPPCVSIAPPPTERSAGAAGRAGIGDASALRDGALTARLLAALESPSAAEAVDALAALVADAPESEEAGAALAEIGTFAAAKNMSPAVAVLDASTSHALAPLRVAAWQALVTSRAAKGDAAGALAATDALLAEGAVVPAEAARVYLHGGAGDTTAAVAALGRLEAAAPGSIEAAVARAYLGMGPDPFGGARGVAPEVAQDARSAAGAAAASLAVSPNPASSSAMLTLTLAEAGEVRVTVHDLLGREVAALDVGAREAGTHRAEVPVAGLAPGVYVVRAVVQGEAAQAVRLTVAR